MYILLVYIDLCNKNNTYQCSNIDMQTKKNIEEKCLALNPCSQYTANVMRHGATINRDGHLAYIFSKHAFQR